MADPVLNTDADQVTYSSPSSANQSVSKATAAASVVTQSELLSRVANSRQSKAAVMVNAAPAEKKTVDVAATAALPEENGTAYGGVGKPYPITLVRIGSSLMEKSTGYDFILMRRAAFREAKIVLKLNSAFRTMEDQERIFADHQAHPEKGPAALPGTSNHQQGLSLDIHTGIDFSDWKAGRVLTSPEHTWLVANAARFGFNQRDLGLLPDGRRFEPWHWTHANDSKIYGLSDPDTDVDGVYSSLVSAGDEAAFSSNGQPDWLRIILKTGSDYIGAFSRSGFSWSSPRQTFQDAGAAQSLLQAGEIQRRGAVQVAVLNAVMPAGFGDEPPLYDFDEGKWTDEGSENAVGV